MIERTISFLHARGIREITIITGYKAEKFAYLEGACGVTLVNNPRADVCNNWSSLLLVKEKLEDTFIIDGDIFFLENFVDFVQPGKSQFISQPTTSGLEWRLITDASGRLTGVSKWEPDGFGLVGVSYWTGEGAALLGQELELCADDEYWEDAALRILDKTPIHAVCIPRKFLYELDSVKDALNAHLLTHEEVARLSSDQSSPCQLKGLTNNTWKIQGHEGKALSLRVPGTGTEFFIDREQEPIVISLIKDLRITPETEFYPGGLKTSRFLEGYHIVTQSDMNLSFFRQLAALLKRLHTVRYDECYGMTSTSITSQIELYEQRSGLAAPPEQRAWLFEKAKYFDAMPQVLCHRDLLLENILVLPGDYSTIQLIDFEYAGFAASLWDSASFILEAGIEDDTRDQFIAAMQIDGEKREDLFWMEILVDYVWGMWGQVNNYLDYAENRLKRSRMKLLPLLGGNNSHI